MKKLMLAAAIVCAAVASQGAAISWYYNSTIYQGYTGGTVSKGVSGTVYLFNYNTTSQNAVLQALMKGGSLASLDGMIDSFTTSDGTMVADDRQTIGAIDAETKEVTGKIGAVRDSSGKKYADVFYAIVQNDYVYLSGTTAKQLSTTQENKIAGSLGTSSKVMNTGSTYGAAGWYNVVPEPTSGLLLLLGVAGLALRRRRA